MNTGLLLLLLVILYNMTADAAYYYNEASEEIPNEFNPNFLSGFRNIIDSDFILGGLFPVCDCCADSGKGNLELLEAMLFAIDQINNDMSLLPNLTIGYDVRDTCNDGEVGVNEAYSLAAEYVPLLNASAQHNASLLGIVGPAHTTVSHSIAAELETTKIPMISYGSSNAFLSNQKLYEYFLRIFPSDNLQTKAMVDLISHFNEWECVSLIYNENKYEESVFDAFINGNGKHNICLNANIGIPSGEGHYNKTFVKTAARELLGSPASVVVAFTDEDTIVALFEELSKINKKRKFVWIASDGWAGSDLIHDKFPEIIRKMYGFQLHIDHFKEFDDYFSQLNRSTNIRNPYFQRDICYNVYCRGYDEGHVSGYDCPDDLTAEPGYTQGQMVPFVIDAVYAYAHALQNFLNDNCDQPLRWDRATQQCDGMKNTLTGETLLGYLLNVSFNGTQNRIVSFDENGDPPGLYKISNWQGQYNHTSVGCWDSVNKDKPLELNNTDANEKVISRCFEPIVVQSDFSNTLSIVSMSIATIALIILAIIVIIFAINWKTPVVKSSDREQTVLMLIGCAMCFSQTYVVVAPPSNATCPFQRITGQLYFPLVFGALLVKIIRITRIFYSIEHSTKKPSFSDAKYQVMFTMAIVFVHSIILVIGLIMDPPIVERNPNDHGSVELCNAPEVFKICQQYNSAIETLLGVYGFAILVGCVILSWLTRKFPENFNEASHVLFTSFTATIVTVSSVPLLIIFIEDKDYDTINALVGVLNAFALLAGIFFPRVYIIVFQKHKNTLEYVKHQNQLYAVHSSSTIRQSKTLTIVITMTFIFLV